jgi:AbrB family looped-hinge helix DNA binding protein
MITAVTKRGQTVIPSELRNQLKIGENSKLEWILDENGIRVIPLPKDTIGKSLGTAPKGLLSKKLLEERQKDRRAGK